MSYQDFDVNFIAQIIANVTQTNLLVVSI